MNNLVYMAKPIYGGWVSFTAHLSLKEKCNIFKIGKRTEKKTRKFGYNTEYKNMKIDEIIKLDNLLITALDKSYYEYLIFFPNNTKIVIHDPTELKSTKKNPNPLIINNLLKKFKIITIRKTVQEYLKKEYNIDSELIYHPFYQYEKNKEPMNNYVVSISRIDFDKNTDILLKYNNLQKDINKKILIFGAENRLYVHHKLKELNFNEYWKGKYPKNLPMTYEDKDILMNCKYMVDLSTIKNDGVGTQYTFLEAIYNDCILILNNEWINKDNLFINNYNCLGISNEDELYDILNEDVKIDKEKIIMNARKILNNH